MTRSASVPEVYRHYIGITAASVSEVHRTTLALHRHHTGTTPRTIPLVHRHYIGTISASVCIGVIAKGQDAAPVIKANFKAALARGLGGSSF